jgi:hypothetical protein
MVRAPETTSGTVSSAGRRAAASTPAVEVEPDHFGHHFGTGAVVRDVHPGEVGLEFGATAFGSQQGMRGEPRGQHSLDHEHALGDHQALTTGEVGAAVHAVEVAEVVEPGISGVDDVDGVSQGSSAALGLRHFRQLLPTSDPQPGATWRARHG